MDEGGAGSSVDCPNCGSPTYVPTQSSTPPPPEPAEEVVPPPPFVTVSAPPPLPAPPTPPTPAIARVVITDIQMPFWRIVAIMVKWAIAAIPAALIMMLIVIILSAVFGLLGLGFLLRGFH